jgi:hypothetical protein
MSENKQSEEPGNRGLDPADVPAIKGMLQRGDVQSDIAAYFGVNAGRVAEINTQQKFPEVEPLPASLPPPPGPYLAARSAVRAKEALIAARVLIDATLQQIERWESRR